MATTTDPVLLTAVNTTDRDVLSTQLLQTQTMNAKTDILRDAINNTASTTDRDVLNGNYKISSKIDDKTAELRDAMNNIARDTNSQVLTVNRDVLHGNEGVKNKVDDKTVELRDAMNNMARDTNNQIITTDRDVLQGNYNLSEGIKGKMDVMGTQNFATLAGIDKDIYKAAYGVNSHLTDAVNAVDKDIIQEFDDVQKINKYNGESSWKKYDSLFQSAEKIGQMFEQNKSMNDTLMQRKLMYEKLNADTLKKNIKSNNNFTKYLSNDGIKSIYSIIRFPIIINNKSKSGFF